MSELKLRPVAAVVVAIEPDAFLSIYGHNSQLVLGQNYFRKHLEKLDLWETKFRILITFSQKKYFCSQNVGEKNDTKNVVPTLVTGI